MTACEVFEDPRIVLAEDLGHSLAERRYYAFGVVDGGVLTCDSRSATGEFESSVPATGERAGSPVKKRIVYTDEPMKVGRRLGLEILPGHGGARPGAGRPASGNKPVTFRLPPDLIEKVRRRAKSAGQTMSEYVAEKLR